MFHLLDQFRKQVAQKSGFIADYVESNIMPGVNSVVENGVKAIQNGVDSVNKITPWDDKKLADSANNTINYLTNNLTQDYSKAETKLTDSIRNQVHQITGLDRRVLAATPLLGLTITKPQYLARGVKQGIASGPDFGPSMQRWRMRRADLMEQMRNPSGSSLDRRKKNAAKAKIAAYNDVSTGPTTDPDDVIAYGKNKFKVKGKDQHHLFPKAESYAFVERMRKIGDDDDVLNLFLYAEELDATMGGRLSNMLNMTPGGKGTPHKDLHDRRIADGRQLRGMGMMNKVNQAKSTDELMDMFDEYIKTNIQPSKKEAIDLQKAFDKARSNLNQFKSLSEAARRRL